MNIVNYITTNWDTLPKSKFDDVIVVIFKELKNEDYGYGHHTYEGYGVDKDGNVTWCYSSGCSCEGGPDTKIEKDLKVFTVNSGVDLNVDPSTINWKSLEVIFNTY
jgi:hypothetical protein